MKVTTAWTDNGDGGGYCLLAAYSETDFDNWCGVPDWYSGPVERESQKEPVRELILEIPDVIVANLFKTPIVKASVVEGES